MSNWNIVKKLITGTGLLVLMLTALGVVAFWGVHDTKLHLDTAVRRTTPKLDLSLRIQQNVVALRSDQRRVLLAGYAKDRARIDESSKLIKDTIALNDERIGQIRQLLVTDKGRQAVNEIETKLNQWEEVEIEV